MMRHDRRAPGHGRVASLSCTLASLLLAAWSLGCSTAASDKQGQVAAAPAELAPGRAAYDQGKSAVLVGDHRRAAELFAQAASEDGGVCEYWYQLGAAESNLAIDVVHDSDAEAVRLFEQSVDHEQRALDLMKEGRCAIWTPDETAQARHDAEMGLTGIEEVLRDRPSLVAALRMYADQRRR